MPGAGKGVDQICFVVPDIEASMRYWASVLGVGPFFHLRRSATRNLFFKGERTAVVSSTALAQAGGVQVEFIQLLNDVPSAYRDVLPHGLGSLHHVGRFVEDYQDTKRRLMDGGLELVQEGDAGPTINFCYLGRTGGSEPLLELIEIPGLRSFFDLISAAARDWDGVEAIREVTPNL
ncbi:hypothetical protein BL253_20740 [Pseudofrankia asymbiotica]|uniref:VOC domain-containing protein n=1 Tax=Pseudofrankia asymbiotica TaxID=1834516 RepID=A0A1V2I7X0_9ACTN|nr:hypothetical protein BL253_20740 [Pseudofrankia asymbiotica]